MTDHFADEEIGITFFKYPGSDMQGKSEPSQPLSTYISICFAKLYFKIEVINKWSCGEK